MKLPFSLFRPAACLVLLLGLSACLEYQPPGAPPGVPVPNNAFGATGTAHRFNPKDRCPEGDINYYLNIGGDVMVRLSVRGSDNDIRAMERAIKTGELVYVTGRRYPSYDPKCYYMLVARVTPLGVPPERERPRARMGGREPSTTTVKDVIVHGAATAQPLAPPMPPVALPAPPPPRPSATVQ